MANRIIELANKANEIVGYKFKLEDAKQLHEFIKEFAELIINECADQTKWSEHEISSEQRIRLAVYHDIRNHFGIK